MATGIVPVTGGTVVTVQSVTTCPACDSATYDISGAPAEVNPWNADGFTLTATGLDGTYTFRIYLEGPVESGFVL